MKKLAVSETFSSIQGEGQTMGVPAVFLRLGGCNLLCESKSWRCDTIEVWMKSKAMEFNEILTGDYLFDLLNGAHLVITGGEPLLHQKHIIEYLLWFMGHHGFLPTVEIETNGTIVPMKILNDLVAYWNVSPKLSTAGEQNTLEQRLNKDALIVFSSYNEKTIFKFVISSDADVIEMKNDYVKHISSNQIVLMPAGSSQIELEHTRQLVANQCKRNKYRYSDRLHVVIWNLKTGV